MTDLIKEKLDQAIEILESQDEIDGWLTFGRETSEIDEPCLPFLLGFDVVWPTMVFLTSEGDRKVIIGRHDAENVPDMYDVRPYDESLKHDFFDVIEEVGSRGEITVGVNYSRDNTAADGLTHGMYLRLQELIEEAPVEVELTSAEEVVSKMRGTKSQTEKRRIEKAARKTEEILSEVTDEWEPGWTEKDVGESAHAKMEEEGLESAWSWDYCPSVHAGPESEVGHTMPGEISLGDNEVLHFDFGVKYEGYAADIQRVYYWSGDTPSEIPDQLQQAFDDVRAAIRTGFEALEPGVKGHEVDRAAREEITSRGWDEYPHALGHQVGRNAHDGGTLLGPEWDRYGELPRKKVRGDEIYTLELGVETEYGYIGQEEMVEVTPNRNEFVVEPQEEIRLLSE